MLGDLGDDTGLDPTFNTSETNGTKLGGRAKVSQFRIRRLGCYPIRRRAVSEAHSASVETACH
jgi:hypothetical protein